MSDSVSVISSSWRCARLLCEALVIIVRVVKVPVVVVVC